VAPILVVQRDRGLLCELDGRWGPTQRGLRFLNDVLLAFLADSTDAADPALSRP
jgi:hypothetical protein